MKFNLAFCLLLSLCSNAQLKYFVEYNVSNIFPSNHIVFDNNISFGITKNKTVGYIGFGREDWYLEYFDNKYYTNPSIYNAHCRTYKVSTLLEHQFFLIKSKLSINLGIGGKIYFFNQMKDSLSTYGPGVLDITKPSYLLVYVLKNPYSYTGSNEYENSRIITSIPYAITTNLAFQYTFKKWALKFYCQAYFMKIKYNLLYPLAEGRIDDGSNFGFYSNLGLGINYPLNFKKKDQKRTTSE